MIIIRTISMGHAMLDETLRSIFDQREEIFSLTKDIRLLIASKDSTYDNALQQLHTVGIWIARFERSLMKLSPAERTAEVAEMLAVLTMALEELESAAYELLEMSMGSQISD